MRWIAWPRSAPLPCWPWPPGATPARSARRRCRCRWPRRPPLRSPPPRAAASPPSSLRVRCGAASPRSRPGSTRPSMRCSITRPISSTAGISRARWPAPRRRPGRRPAPSRPTTIAPSRSCASTASTRRATRSRWRSPSAPDDPETLEAAADLNINQLPPSADRSALGLEYARRGSRHVPHRDGERAARLALLEGQALIDLGRGAEALRRIDAALAAAPGFAAASYERGVALFELCRFDEARRDVREGARRHPGPRARALPPRPHRGAGRRRGGRRAPPRRRERRRPEVVPGPARRLADRLRGPRSARRRRPRRGLQARPRRDQDRGGRPPRRGRSDRREAAPLADDPGPLPGPAPRLWRARRGADAGRASEQGEGARRPCRRPAPRRARRRPPPPPPPGATPTSAPSSFTAATCSAPCATPPSSIRRSAGRSSTRSATSAAKTTGRCATAASSRRSPRLASSLARVVAVVRRAAHRNRAARSASAPAATFEPRETDGRTDSDTRSGRALTRSARTNGAARTRTAVRLVAVAARRQGPRGHTGCAARRIRTTRTCG